MRKILVTSALPYANGPIHLGHLVEYIQTDIWVRAMRAFGHQVSYVCADDAHGTAIMLRAEANGVSAETLIADIQHQHQRDFSGFSIGFDHYGSTHCSENQHLAESIYRKVRAAGAIAQRPIQQLFDQEKNLFLADRFVKGQCPKCHAVDQYGDSCEVCGSTYNATELGNPVSTLSGSVPVIRESEHYFFELPKFSDFLTQWTQTPKRLQSSIANKLHEWLDSGLVDWDISRDAPYFGFAIPDTTDKYFYVWLDAPIGYMASFEQLCQTRSDLNFNDYWQADSQTELYHFIGKDIINFHGLFWPAMLHCAGYRTPTAIFAHGFLTVNGQKMSKSRGTFITAETYLKHLNPDYLRYYFASKLGQTVDDIDLNLNDFSQKVNSDLVGKLVNIASRCASFLDKYFARTLVKQLDDSAPLNQLIAAKNTLTELFEARDFARATREIMQLADLVNEYIDLHKPWALAKDAEQLPQVHQVCSMGILCYRLLILYLSPILPTLAQHSADFLGMETTRWDSYDMLYTGHTLNAFTPLLQRIENSKIEAIIAESASSMPTATPIQVTTKTTADIPMQQPIIGIEDFKKLDIRIGKIVDAQIVEGSDKLLALLVDVGESIPRTILSGIREYYAPEQLVGQLTLVLVNLAPRKMRFGTSNGMVLAAGNAYGIYLIHPDSGAQPGDLVS